MGNFCNILNKFGNLGLRKKFRLCHKENLKWKISFKMNCFFWNLKKKWQYHQRGKWKELKKMILKYTTRGKWKNWNMPRKFWNEEIIYFIYVTEIKLSIIPSYHLCILPYSTGASCCGIQLISAVGSFHIGPFSTAVKGDMVHRKRAPISFG
jgi:hypothetical protein